MNRWASVCALIPILLVSARAPAWAYSATEAFARDPTPDPAGGGGGIYFTGSPRQHGLNCSACHIGGPAGTALRVSALLEGAASTLFSQGYEPGKAYEIEVAFDGDLLGPPAGCQGKDTDACDLNLFALEILDEEGRPQGSLCPVAPTDLNEVDRCAACPSLDARGTRVESSCTVVLANALDTSAGAFRNGVTAYSFFWRAPADDVGPVLVYVSGVDGRGKETPEGEDTSYQNDGVVSVRIPIDSPTLAFREPSSGCRATRMGGSPWPAGLLLLWGFLRLRSR